MERKRLKEEWVNAFRRVVTMIMQYLSSNFSFVIIAESSGGLGDFMPFELAHCDYRFNSQSIHECRAHFSPSHVDAANVSSSRTDRREYSMQL